MCMTTQSGQGIEAAYACPSSADGAALRTLATYGLIRVGAQIMWRVGMTSRWTLQQMRTMRQRCLGTASRRTAPEGPQPPLPLPSQVTAPSLPGMHQVAAWQAFVLFGPQFNVS